MNSLFAGSAMGWMRPFELTWGYPVPLIGLDDQLFRGQIKPLSYRIRRDIGFSDHYPLEVIYEFP
jgi:hypothetical protein